MTGEGERASADWPERPYLLACLLALAGLFVHFAMADSDPEPIEMGFAALFFFGPLTLAFTAERDRIVPAALFSGVVGLAMLGLAWRVASADDSAADAAFWLAAGVLSLLLAIPLYQSGFLKDRLNTSYEATHFHVWTDALSAAGALAFTGLSWALLAIIGALFGLLEIDLIEELIDEEWFAWMFSGAAFGAALGVLRNQLGVLATVQSVAMLVLSLLAIPLAAALAIFLLAMIVSGPQVLWNATDSATPILLACAVGAFVLANAVLRDKDADMRGNRLTRAAALVLALSIAPLSIFAVVSMGLRIAQHGLSPERIWGLIAVSVAVVYGVGYAVNVLRGWKGGAWRDLVRRANLHMAVLVCAVAAVLALPIFDFGAVSARDQIARLKSGAVSLEEFDMAALRWDFGDAGRAALRRLSKSDDAAIAERAKLTLAQEYRPYRGQVEEPNNRRERLANLRVQIEDEQLAETVRNYVAEQDWRCENPCVALDLGSAPEERRWIALVQGTGVETFVVDPGNRRPVAEMPRDTIETDPTKLEYQLDVGVTEDSRVEIREWTGRRIYVDGKPVGEAFQPAQ